MTSLIYIDHTIQSQPDLNWTSDAPMISSISSDKVQIINSTVSPDWKIQIETSNDWVIDPTSFPREIHWLLALIMVPITLVAITGNALVIWLYIR